MRIDGTSDAVERCEQVEESLKANNIVDGSERHQRVIELLEHAGLPDAERRATQFPHEFSGGMRQRALIAMGLAANPELLIADEPTSALDVTVQKRILDHLETLTQESQTALLFITHDLGLAAERADHLLVMHRGRVVERGPSLDILRNPKHPYTKKLLAAIPDLPGRKNITGHGQASSVATEKPGSAAPLLKVRDLKMAYGDNTVLHGIDLTLEQGESILLLGESGSGKTTLARSIAGLNPGYTGDVRLRGEVLEHSSRKRSLDQRPYIQYIFQSPFSSLNPRRTIGESLSVPLIMSGRLSRRDQRKAVEEILEAVQLDRSFYDRRPGDLSGGERQRAAIGRALVNAPDVLVCDEITSALDVSVQASILSLLADLRAERDLSLLFVTHNIALARHTATRIAVLNKGIIVDEGPVDEVLEHPTHDYTKALLANIPEL